MAQGSRVPKFGAWGSGENTPNYTTLFNRAREDRIARKKINPNDPQQNQHMFPNTTRTRVERGPIRKGVDNMGSRAAGDQSPHQRHGADGGVSGGRQKEISLICKGLKTCVKYLKRNMNPSDFFPRVAPVSKSKPNEGTAVPKFGEWDEKKPETGNDFTPIFRRLRKEKHNGPGKSLDHVPVRGTVVPKFGEWDETKPETSDDFTPIFRRLQEEKHNGPGKSPVQVPDGGTGVPEFGEWDDTDAETWDNFDHIFKRVGEEKQNGPGKSRSHVAVGRIYVV